MPCLGTTVTVHRVGMLDLSSLTARIIPVTGNPFNINRALSPPVLGVAAAPGLYRTRDFDSLHASPMVAVSETSPATIRTISGQR
jgi:hypothetical protein